MKLIRMIPFVIPLSSKSMSPVLVRGWLLFMAARDSGPVYTTKPNNITCYWTYSVHNQTIQQTVYTTKPKNIKCNCTYTLQCT